MKEAKDGPRGTPFVAKPHHHELARELLMTTDLAALLAALDRGDDSALPAIADWIEEAGDRQPHEKEEGCVPAWLVDSGPGQRRPEPIEGWYGWWYEYTRGVIVDSYPTRRAAYLALAAALVPSQE